MVCHTVKVISVRRHLRSRIVEVNRRHWLAFRAWWQWWRHVVRHIQPTQWKVNLRFELISEVALRLEALQMNEQYRRQS